MRPTTTLRLVVAALVVAATAVGVPGGARSGAPVRDLVLLSENAYDGWSLVDIGRHVRTKVIHASYFDFVRSPDGARVAFPCRWADRAEYLDARAVCVRRLDGGSHEVVIRPASGRYRTAGGLQWSPDGRWLSVIWGDADPNNPTSRGELESVRADGSGRRRLASVDVSADAVWAPDSSLLAYGADGVWVVRPDGSGRRRIAEGSPEQVAWSPAGSLIAYVKRRTPADRCQVCPPAIPGARRRNGLWVVRPDGSASRRLVASPQELASWSADGRFIAYGRLVVDTRTGRTTTMRQGVAASFAPVGTRRLLLGPAGRVSLASPGGRVLWRVTGNGTYVVWAPDGRRIAYVNGDGLWVADLVHRDVVRALRWHLPFGQVKGPLIWR